MYWDTLLLLPLVIAVAVYYVELFRVDEDLTAEITLESSCASEGKTLLLRYNKRTECRKTIKLNSTGNALKSKSKEGSSGISNSTFEGYSGHSNHSKGKHNVQDT